MSLVHGSLSDALGRRRVLSGPWSLYVLASLGCAFAPGFGALLVFRALQGMVAGVGMIVGRAIVRDCYAGVQAQRVMSTITMIFAHRAGGGAGGRRLGARLVRLARRVRHHGAARRRR